MGRGDGLEDSVTEAHGAMRGRKVFEVRHKQMGGSFLFNWTEVKRMSPFLSANNWRGEHAPASFRYQVVENSLRTSSLSGRSRILGGQWLRVPITPPYRASGGLPNSRVPWYTSRSFLRKGVVMLAAILAKLL